MSFPIRSRLYTLLALTTLLPAAAAAQMAHPNTDARMAEVTRFRAEYNEAFNRKDAAAMAAAYESDAIAITGKGLLLKGRDQIFAYFARGASQLPHLVITSDTVTFYGDLAVDVGTLTAHPANGAEDVSRFVSLMRRGPEGWKVVRVSVTPIVPN